MDVRELGLWDHEIDYSFPTQISSGSIIETQIAFR